ncbi:hypothetical protein BISA_0962 [Bifidobacterium saguini DSM 23967]|uniref:Uncharacterized protein n=1 Tax=Bifidobacterium saguini DSM 23967 TaxID=1437607 RepID=A0A087D825_9BIFI|nr:hypothetical protein [Bifidobacterium saguini]KFI91675.1 hypothetical protein BISA_0962 [Bifidobacterium saguini DSM 23967]
MSNANNEAHHSPAETKPQQQSKATWTQASGPKQARLTIAVTVVAVVLIALGLGFFVSWGLAAIAVIIMVPGAISLAIIAKHPESTGGRSMLGISNPDTLLDPLRRPSERRGK